MTLSKTPPPFPGQNNILPVNQIICGDCLYKMSAFPTNCIDLVVTSPPYDNLRNYQGYSFDFERIAQQLYRITKPGGVVIWVVGDATIKGSETGTSFKQALYFKEVGFNLHDTMIWRKTNPFNFGSNNCYIQSFEYMFIFSKGKPGAINFIQDRKIKSDKPFKAVSKDKNNNRFESGKIINPKDYSKRYNVWDIPCATTKREHPAIFPEKLAADHIKSWSNPGDIVLDPMCGSGITCKEARKLNRRYVGIDISQEYCSIARKGLDN